MKESLFSAIDWNLVISLVDGASLAKNFSLDHPVGSHPLYISILELFPFLITRLFLSMNKMNDIWEIVLSFTNIWHGTGISIRFLESLREEAWKSSFRLSKSSLRNWAGKKKVFFYVELLGFFRNWGTRKIVFYPVF